MATVQIFNHYSLLKMTEDFKAKSYVAIHSSCAAYQSDSDSGNEKEESILLKEGNHEKTMAIQVFEDGVWKKADESFGDNTYWNIWYHEKEKYAVVAFRGTEVE